MDAKTRRRIDALAGEYLAFLQANPSQRQSSAALLALARAQGARPFGQSGQHRAGELLYWQDEAQGSLAFLKVGKAPAADGLRILISASDSAHLRLTARPLYEKAGLALLDTTVLGRLDLSSWLHTPLALHVFVAGRTPNDKGRAIIIGDEPGEPVFSIPDLLPHLSRKVQRSELVDSPERLDAVAGFSRASLVAGLERYGLRASDLDRAEATLLPAAAPGFIGVDRALIAASNHRARALPFAALRALLRSDDQHSQLVIIMGQTRSSATGAGPEQHLRNLLPVALGQLGAKPDALAFRRVLARSSVLLFDHAQGERNRGVALNTRRDDSSPRSFREAIARFESAGVQLQIVEASGWSEARELASLDIDTVELGLPIAGLGSPFELVSILDLHQAERACLAWLQGTSQ